jgi:glycosyltransferase involved in cell wall biosynthesis
MKILTIHNRYKYRGGEDESREAEDTLLAAKGNEIRQILFDNAQINARNALKVGLQATWSHQSYVRVRDYIKHWRPDILDVHNFFPLASPSVYYAARRLGVPVVQTLHNYRILCPGANFYRNGAVCEDCTGRLFPWPGIVHQCYRGSALQTSAVALMTASHRLMRTWDRTVSFFFVLSEFAKRKFVENGIAESKIVVKPNFVVDPGQTGGGGDEFLYAGRLSPEKGIRTLLRGIAGTRSPNARFRIVGDGPLEPEVREAAFKDARITYDGRLPLARVMDLMAGSRAVIVPSECYETFGRAAAEAFAAGTPVICSDTGAVAEIVDDGLTGFHFRSGDGADLGRIIDQICADPDVPASMRKLARATYEARYTAERGYTLIMGAYERAIAVP